MRDLPMFTTQSGVAALTLKEIPYTQTAYIRIQASSDPEALLEECVGFCKAVGAQKIFASGTGIPKEYPLHTEILEMRVRKMELPDTNATLQPVCENTLEMWRQHYNHRMKDVANAAWMDKDAALDMLRNGSGYFVEQDGELIGIGMVRDNVLMAVASLVRGAGRDVTLALIKTVRSEEVLLEVASANHHAMKLYHSLGFAVSNRKSAWYKIF